VLQNVDACLPDYTVPQLRISLVSEQFGVQKTNRNKFHVYTVSTLCCIQSIRVMHCARGEICPRGNLESDSLALQECSNSKEQLLFLAT